MNSSIVLVSAKIDLIFPYLRHKRVKTAQKAPLSGPSSDEASPAARSIGRLR